MLKRCRITMVLLVATFLGCGGGDGVGTSAGNPVYFPQGLAVASPFDTTEPNENSPSLSTRALAQDRPFISRYEDATNRINEILNGETANDCLFDPAHFLTTETNAPCYGPTVQYEGHPDAAPGDPARDGQLPSGDVGIWIETDRDTDHACAAAQLNARLESLRSRSLAALSGLASLICTANANGIAFSTNRTEDLESEMNALGIADTIFHQATITHSDSSGADAWSYHLDLTLTRNGDASDIVVDLTHIPGAEDNIYRGRLSYRVNEIFQAPENDEMAATAGNCPNANQTHNGSLLYNRTSSQNLGVQSRSGGFCEHDSDGTTDGLVDPSKKHDGGADPRGWANNFNIFTAAFDPSTLAGQYTFSWQAGDGDGYSRVFNAIVAEENEGALSGDAFYGFGDDIEETDGAITGFFCNWAGPSSRQNFANLAQYQSMELNQNTGKFDVGTSNINYAPTNSCNYDGNGDFTFDSDVNGSVDTNSAEAITNDLTTLEDSDGSGTFDVFEASGFVLPVPPANL